MTDCSDCGSSSLPGQKFCAECGSSLERDNAPGAGDVSGELTAQQQSEPAVRTCSACGTPIEVGSHYCFDCGKPVDELPDVSKLEPIPASVIESTDSSTSSDAAAGFLGALWGGSASCGCGCFSLVIVVGMLAVLGAFL